MSRLDWMTRSDTLRRVAALTGAPLGRAGPDDPESRG